VQHWSRDGDGRLLVGPKGERQLLKHWGNDVDAAQPCSLGLHDQLLQRRRQLGPKGVRTYVLRPGRTKLVPSASARDKKKKRD
jgi:hypothetical protein